MPKLCSLISPNPHQTKNKNKKCAANIVGGLLGLLFIAFGYLAFVKCLEILGGVLVAIPKTRNFGLLVLGPIIINILAFHVFLTKGAGFADPVVSLIAILPLFLLWTSRKAFAGLLN